MLESKIILKLSLFLLVSMLLESLLMINVLTFFISSFVIKSSFLLRFCLTIKILFNVWSPNLFRNGVFVSFKEEKTLSISAVENGSDNKVWEIFYKIGNLLVSPFFIRLMLFHWSKLLMPTISSFLTDLKSLISMWRS